MPRAIYISGPMSGLPDLNFPAFAEAENALIAAGWRPVNPAKVAPIGGTDWENYMRGDLRELCYCDALALLDGWQNSRGAQLEVHVAHRLGIKIMTIEEAMSCPTDSPAP